MGKCWIQSRAVVGLSCFLWQEMPVERFHGYLRYPYVTQSRNLTSPRRAECFSNIWSANTWLTVPLEKAWKKIRGALMIVFEGHHPQSPLREPLRELKENTTKPESL